MFVIKKEQRAKVLLCRLFFVLCIIRVIRGQILLAAPIPCIGAEAVTGSTPGLFSTTKKR
jgi:hypothetical protein